MSKVICDVCGTTYPETASRCPICNSAKDGTDQTTAGENDASGYAYVKGGRFSKKNVRKIGKKGNSAQRRTPSDDSDEEQSSNAGLVIVVILLLLAIVAVCVFIYQTYMKNDETADAGKDPVTNTSESATDATDETSVLVEGVPCEEIRLSSSVIELGNAGDTWTLIVDLSPVDTTQYVTFTSSDENVVTVSDSGVLTAIGYGQAVITATCGDATATCAVNCTFGEPAPTDPEPTTGTVTGEFKFAFNTKYVDANGDGDTTLSTLGQTWQAYKSNLSIDPTLITWTSDNESVCVVKAGIVTAVGHGTTKIHATYNGVTYNCVIRCPFSGSMEPSDVSGDCTINHTDVTISVGQSFKLTLKDVDGNVLDVTWTATGDGVTISGNDITGATAGTVTVSTTYNDVTYSCIVRVKN